MTREELVGYIGAPLGNEASLTAFDAVTRSAGGFRRYPAAGGEPQEVSASEVEYALPVPSELSAQWRRGHVVWFAGRTFAVRGTANSAVRAFLTDWALTDQGHRMSTGTPRELLGLRDTVARELAMQVSNYLFDELERRHDQAADVFELFLAVENTPSTRRFLTAALYYFQTRRIEEYEFTRERAALSRAFDSAEAFDVQFGKHREWLATGRSETSISELGVTRQGAVSAFEAQARALIWVAASASNDEHRSPLFSESSWIRHVPALRTERPWSKHKYLVHGPRQVETHVEAAEKIEFFIQETL